MAITATQYPLSVTHGIDYAVDTIMVALVTSGYTYSATHEFFSDITSEVVGTAYVAGGATMTTPTQAWDAGTTTEKFSFDDVVWATATFTARGAVVYKSTGTSTTSPLLGFVDFGADQNPVATNFTLHVNAAGLLTRQIIAAS